MDAERLREIRERSGRGYQQVLSRRHVRLEYAKAVDDVRDLLDEVERLRDALRAYERVMKEGVATGANADAPQVWRDTP